MKLLVTKGAKRKIEEGFNRLIIQKDFSEHRFSRKARNLLEFYAAGL